MLQSMRLQRIGHDLATEQQWCSALAIPHQALLPTAPTQLELSPPASPSPSGRTLETGNCHGPYPPSSAPSTYDSKVTALSWSHGPEGARTAAGGGARRGRSDRAICPVPSERTGNDRLAPPTRVRARSLGSLASLLPSPSSAGPARPGSRVRGPPPPPHLLQRLRHQRGHDRSLHPALLLLLLP